MLEDKPLHKDVKVKIPVGFLQMKFLRKNNGIHHVDEIGMSMASPAQNDRWIDLFLISKAFYANSAALSKYNMAICIRNRK